MRFTPHLAPHISPNGVFSANYKFSHCGPHFTHSSQNTHNSHNSHANLTALCSLNRLSISRLCVSPATLSRVFSRRSRISPCSLFHCACVVYWFISILLRSSRKTRCRMLVRDVHMHLYAAPNTCLLDWVLININFVYWFISLKVKLKDHAWTTDAYMEIELKCVPIAKASVYSNAWLGKSVGRELIVSHKDERTRHHEGESTVRTESGVGELAGQICSLSEVWIWCEWRGEWARCELSCDVSTARALYAMRSTMIFYSVLKTHRSVLNVVWISVL